MKKTKILALALAGALACPQVAFAARDGDGMEYVSAAEGFYGSLRTMYSSNSGEKDMNGKITGDGSRLGVRGTLDLGHGLTGLYRYEWRVKDLNSGDAANGTRLHYVGLKGTFGEAQFGTLWENDYNWVTAATDIATTGSGNFAPHFRRNNSLQYTSPDLNGFQGSFRVMMDGGADTAASSDANVDEYAIVGKYGVRGFTIAGAYEVQPDGATDIATSLGADFTLNDPAVTDANADTIKAKEDATFWAIRGGYSQDNWAVNAWYGVHNTSDTKSAIGVDTNGSPASLEALQTPDDTKVFSVSGNIDIGKVGLVVIHENKEFGYHQMAVAGDSDTRKTGIMKGDTDSATIFNVNYHFTKKSRVYFAYIARDNDTKKSTMSQAGAANPHQPDDEVRIGLRMDF